MTVRSTTLSALAAISLALVASAAGAQKWQPFGPVDIQYDLQPFKTFEIRNFTNRPDVHEGFYFSFDKLNWAISGERNIVGNPNVTGQPVDIFPGAPNPPPTIVGSLWNAPPDAKFWWGERYDLGYVVGHHGWHLGVLDGPDALSEAFYGFVDELFTDPQTENDIGLPTTEITVRTHPATGTVYIPFASPPGFLDGFFFVDTDGDTLLDAVLDVNGDGLLTFDDLVTYLTTYDQVHIRNRTNFDGVELMKTYRFKPGHKGGVVEFFYGARYLRVRDDFRVDALGGILTDLNILPATVNIDDRTDFWNTRIDNHIVGPQVGLKWFRRTGRWTIRAQGRCMLGYNVQNHNQVGVLGSGLDVAPPFVPGLPLMNYFNSPYAFRSSKQEDEFSPVVELRLEATYHLTEKVAVKLGYTGTFIDNIRRASQQTDYTLPKMGFVDGGTQEILANGAHGGIEVNY